MGSLPISQFPVVLSLFPSSLLKVLRTFTEPPWALRCGYEMGRLVVNRRAALTEPGTQRVLTQASFFSYPSSEPLLHTWP